MIKEEIKKCGYTKCNRILDGRSDQQYCCRKHKDTVRKQRTRLIRLKRNSQSE